MIRARSLLLAPALGAFLLVAGAHAQSPADKALAETLFREGRMLMEGGKPGEACTRFADSQRLDPSEGTLLNLAMCHEQLGMTATAWAEFTELAQLAKRSGQKQREEFARKRADELERALFRLVIVLVEPDDAVVVTVDGSPLSAGSIGTPLPLDPGAHRIEARAEGKKPWSKVVTLGTGLPTQSVAIPALERSLSPGDGTEEEAGISPLVYVGFGVGAAGILAGAITGGISLSKAGDVREACGDDDVCPESARSNYDDAWLLANVSNVAFAVGAVGVVLGLVGLGLSDFDDSSTEAAIRPFIGPGSAGLLGRF